MKLPREPNAALRAWPFPRVRERVVRAGRALEVVDVGDRRELRAHGDSTQGAVRFDEPARPALAYLESAVAAIAVQPPTRVLCIGLGPGAIPRLVSAWVPDATIDAVELDPLVVELARRWFGVDDLPKLKVHVADGRAFLEATAGPWDLVFCDAYDGADVPAHLDGEPFLRLVQARLATRGVLASNVWPSVRDVRGQGFVDRHRRVFTDVARLPCRGAPNEIVVARKDAALPSVEGWLRRLSAWPEMPDAAFDAVRGLDRE